MCKLSVGSDHRMVNLIISHAQQCIYGALVGSRVGWEAAVQIE